MDSLAPTKKSWILLLITLVIFVFGISMAQLIDTQGGKVNVQDTYFTSSRDGSLLHGRLYTPTNATAKTPAPAFIFYHGNDGDCDKYSMFGVELSRRGYVAFICDMRGQGQSVGSVAKGDANDTYGAVEATEYLRSMSFVDSSNITISGHSLGGLCAAWAYAVRPEYYKGLVFIGIKTADFNKAIPTETKVNVFLSTGRDDGDSVNHTTAAAYFGNCTPEEFIPGKVYGSFEDNTARENYQAMDAIHNTEYINKQTLRHILDFVQGVSRAPTPIDGNSQVWLFRFLSTSLAYFALIFMLLPLGSILLNTPFFGAICRTPPEYKGNTKMRWWFFAILTVVVAPLTYFHLTSTAGKWMPIKVFSVQRATLTLGWALIIAVFTIAVLVIGYFLTRKEKRPSLVNYGLTYEKGQNFVNIAKSLLLSFIMVFAIYSLLEVTYRWTLIDVRIWNSSLRVISSVRIGRILTYYIPFAFAYVVLAVNLHGTLRPKSGNISIIREILLNIVLIAPWYYVWAIWFGPFSWLQAHGAVPSFGGMMYSFFWAVPIIMAVIATVSTYFFRKTGRVWLGAFISAWLISWALLGGFSMMLGALPPK